MLGIERRAGVLALVLCAPALACGGGAEPVLISGALGAGSLECAENWLLAADYEVDRSENVVDAQLTIMSGDIASRREFIRVAVVSPDGLQTRVTAHDLQPAAEPTLTRPLISVPTDPLPGTLTLAELIVGECGG